MGMAVGAGITGISSTTHGQDGGVGLVPSLQSVSAASRSEVRGPLNHVTVATTDTVHSHGSFIGSGVETGTWSIGDSTAIMDVPYSQTPMERVRSMMNGQSSKDIARLVKSDRSVDGFGDSKTVNAELPLNKEMMSQLSQSYAKMRPSGFNEHHDTGDIGNAYSFSQCTWWAYVRRHQLGLPAGSHMGDGRMWASTARRLGYWVDRNPMVGDVVVFQPGQAGADGTYGHVGVVENVIESDGRKWIVTSESSAEYNGKHFSRIIGDVERFEYIHS